MKTYAVTSGKGGVGKTSVAANLAIAMSAHGLRVVVFDADLELANLDVMLGVKASKTLQHVLTGDATLSEIVTPGPGGIGAIFGGSAISTLMTAGPKRLGMFISQLPELAETTDVLIFDSSAGLDNKMMTFLRLADEVVLVTTPDPASVTDAYATLKVLFRRKPESTVHVVVNMATDDNQARGIFDALQTIVWRYLNKDLHFVGGVRHDAKALEATRKRVPYTVGAPNSAAALDMKAVASSVSNYKTSVEKILRSGSEQSA